MFATTADGVQDCKNGKLKWTGPYIPRNFNELLQVADKDGDGMVSKAELNKYFEGYVDADDVDLDNNNEITSNEYQTLLNYLGSKYSGVVGCSRPEGTCGVWPGCATQFEYNADGSLRACCDQALHTGQCCEYNYLKCTREWYNGEWKYSCEQDGRVHQCTFCPTGKWDHVNGCCRVPTAYGQCPDPPNLNI